MIKIVGNQFQLENERRPYHFQTWFKWSSLFYAPHRDLGKARASLQRAKALGFDGLRVLDEHHDWEGNTFLETGVPINTPWNLAMSPGSSFALSPAQKRAYDDMANMLDDEDMYIELVINATIKTEPGFLRDKHERMVAFWERMQRVVLQYLRTIQADRFVLENCNEFTAHVPKAAYEYLRNDANGVDLLPRMAYRARTQDYPGRPYGISDGGTWNPEVPGGFSHLNLHSERGERWWDIHGELARLTAYYPNIPKTLNENMNGMSEAQWRYWVTQGHHGNPAKLAAQSRPDTPENVERMRKQWEKAEEFGWSYTLHNTNGIFSDPDAPEDGFEREWARTHGGEPGGEPVQRKKYEGWIKKQYREVLGREADPAGLEHYNDLIEDEEIDPTELTDILYRSAEYLNKPELWNRGDAIAPPTPTPPKPPEPPPEPELIYWDEVAEQRFGHEPHPSANWESALKSVSQQLTWDGVRNPIYALKCPAAIAQYGETAASLRAIIRRCQYALDTLHTELIELDDDRQPVGGYWSKAPISMDRFTTFWYDVILPAQEVAERLNGIKGRAKELCE